MKHLTRFRHELKFAFLASMPLILASACARFGFNSPRPQFAQWQQTAPIGLPNQWSLRPAGTSIALGDLPLSMAVSPDGRYVAVVHSGYGQHEIVIVSIADRAIVHREKLDNTWLGCAFTPDGKRLIANGGADDQLYDYAFANGVLKFQFQKNLKSAAAAEGAGGGGGMWYPGGIAIEPQGRFAYVAAQYGNRLVKVDLTKAQTPATTVCSFDDPHAYPYRVVLNKRGDKAWVSLWGGASVAAVNLADGKFSLLPVDSHPNDLLLAPDESRLFVACGNTNLVDAIDLATGKVSEKLDAGLYPGTPEGTTPNALALDPSGKTLLVANADNNTVAEFDVSEAGRARPVGLIPVGWYPTAVAFANGGNEILVANGKGNGSLPNPKGPQANVARTAETQYIAGLLPGSLSFIQTPNSSEIGKYTQAAYACSPLREDLAPVEKPGDSPIPAKVGDPCPIQYCVYIIRENRTYDQVLGDIKEGNGDPKLCLFPQEVTPNTHALVKEFALLDNFYVDAEVSADGHEWTMGAYANDYTEKTWPVSYGGHARVTYMSEGQDPVSDNVSGYLWDKAKEAGVSYRSYGEWVHGGGPDGDAEPDAKSLEGHFNPYYAAYGLGTSDIDRANVFIKELQEFSAKKEMPRLAIVRLPNDHTGGTRRGSLSPRAFVAQNDRALGMIVEALSKSPFWSKMAIFVVEDDAQNGPDHVDAHRSEVVVAGPYVKRGVVEHAMYSTSSVLRTIELILGLKPMSQYDAAARPMYRCFTNVPDAKPYAAIVGKIDIDEVNGTAAPMQRESSQLILDREDANDDILFNRIIWQSVRGAGSEMPPPVRAAFIRPAADRDDD